LRHPERSPHQAENADDEPDPAQSQGMDVLAYLVADDRKVAERGSENPSLQRRIASEREPEERDQQQQEREECKEAVVRQECREPTRAIVAELLHDRDRERESRSLLLSSIETAYESLDLPHSVALPHNRLPQTPAVVELPIDE